MLSTFIALLPSMLLGAQILLIIILLKGDICPGQRGRLHKVLPIVALFWLPVVWVLPVAIIVPVLIAAFCSQVQTKKTRDQGPVWILHSANVLSLVVFIWLLGSTAITSLVLMKLLALLSLGAIFAHNLLVFARSRLQAFHRLLPLSGVLCAIGIVLVVCLYAVSFDEQVLSQYSQQLLVGLPLLVLSVVIWCWHLLNHQKPLKVQVFVSGLIMLVALTYLLSFMQQLAFS